MYKLYNVNNVPMTRDRNCGEINSKVFTHFSPHFPHTYNIGHFTKRAYYVQKEFIMQCVTIYVTATVYYGPKKLVTCFH